MKINISKTRYMHITTKRTILNFSYEVAGVGLTEVDSYKYLGVILSCDLGRKKHVEYVKKRATNKLWYLSRTMGEPPPFR